MTPVLFVERAIITIITRMAAADMTTVRMSTTEHIAHANITTMSIIMERAAADIIMQKDIIMQTRCSSVGGKKQLRITPVHSCRKFCMH